jgi:hypothetical protein
MTKYSICRGIAIRTMRSIAILLALISSLSGPAYAMVGVSQNAGAPLELIVQYQSATVAPSVAAGVGDLDRIRPGKRVMKFNSEAELQRAMEQLRSDPNVLYVEQSHTATAQFVPNDPLYSQQWDKAIQRLSVANDKETGKSNVIVLVSDTAFDCTVHPDLAPNCRQDLSRNFITDPVFMFHGFHVAGIAAAAINNSTAIAGTAGTAKIAFARFLDHAGTGSFADGLKTWQYALTLADQGFKVVVNNSWGGPDGPDQSYMEAAAAMKAAGIVVLAAAGNNKTDNCTTKFWPAAYKDVISIASTDENDALSSFSNFGNCPEDQGGVFVAAPGSNIVSLDEFSGTRKASGTSMATPQVAGAVALMMSQDPTLSIDNIKERLREGSVAKGLPIITGARLDLPGMLVAPAPGVRLSISCPIPAEVNQAETLACTASMRGVGGYAGSATLDCSGVPSSSCVVDPPNIQVGQTASVKLTPSRSTVAPQSYVLTVHAAAPDAPGEDSTQIPVKVWPFGRKTLQFTNTTIVPIGNLCPAFKCPTGVAETKIHVPDKMKVFHLVGVAHLNWPFRDYTVSLISPAGTSFNVPTPGIVRVIDSVFETDIYNGEMTEGDWTMRMKLNDPKSIFTGSLNGWGMSITALPLEEAPPPPPPPDAPVVNFPTVSFDWSSDHASSCAASDAWSGGKPASGSLSMASPFDGNYTLTCTGAGGTSKRTLSVTVH